MNTSISARAWLVPTLTLLTLASWRPLVQKRGIPPPLDSGLEWAITNLSYHIRLSLARL
jgi:hypothetical protein